MATATVQKIRDLNGGYSTRIVYRVRGYDSDRPNLQYIQREEALRFWSKCEPNEKFIIRATNDGFVIERYMHLSELTPLLT